VMSSTIGSDETMVLTGRMQQRVLQFLFTANSHTGISAKKKPRGWRAA
jgi:hypothetical protein